MKKETKTKDNIREILQQIGQIRPADSAAKEAALHRQASPGR